MSTTASPAELYKKQHPLAHPGIFSRECFDFDHELPPHLSEIYHSVFKAQSDHYPDAPKRLVRLMPREHGKSVAATVVTPTWLALRNPNERILIMSQTEGQARGKVRQIRGNIERLADAFGREIEESNKSQITLKRSEEHDVPTVKAAGFNTGVTGGHHTCIVFDDIIDWSSQQTEARRNKIWQQFQDYLNLGSGGETVYLVVGTRKHPSDIYNQLIEGPAWDSLVKKAIGDFSIIENGEYDVRTDKGNIYAADEIEEINSKRETIVSVEPHRDVPVLWPERWPLENLILDLISGYGAQQGSLIWQRENLNDASSLQGQVLSEDMLTFVDKIPTGREGCSWYAGLDPAVEDDPEKAASNDTDYWALAFMAYSSHDQTAYLDKVVRKRGMTINEGLSWVAAELKEYKNVGISKVLVEDAQAQRWFVSSGKDKGLPLKRSNSSGKKEQRILDMSARFENRKIKIVNDSTSGRSEMWQSFVNEWAAFPSGDFDDRLDSVEIATRALPTGGERSYSFH